MSTQHTDSDTDTDRRTDTDTDHTQADFSVGDVVDDREADLDELPVVINLPPVAASDWEAYHTDDGAVTVAEDNPAYDADADVVVVMFPSALDDWGREWDGEAPIPLANAPGGSFFAFPPARLEPTGETYGDAQSDDDQGDSGEEAAPEPTLRDRLDAIAAAVGDLNVDDVAVDTFREAVVVEKLGTEYRIGADGEVDADDPLAERLEAALDEAEVAE